jgi:hypothetical protein
MINLLPLIPNPFTHDTMTTPKETAEIIARNRLSRIKAKEVTSTTPSRTSMRHGSVVNNSRDNSPAKGESPKKRKNPEKPKSPANAKSPIKAKNVGRAKNTELEVESTDDNNDQREEAHDDVKEPEALVEKEDSDGDEDPGFKPDYKGRVVSYKDPETDRPGHGIVGEYVAGEGYHVLFTYTDDLEPRECVDHCPLHWIDASLVDEAVASAWKTAIAKESLHDSPKNARTKKASPVPTS